MTTANVESADLYERLGIDRHCSAGDVKRAYRALIRRFSPERAPEQFKRIREAFETLSNAQSRAEYDSELAPDVQRLLSDANQAMEAKQYAAAERLLKQALIAEPGLNYVRNLLGLCFLYQGRPSDAVREYARLLRVPGADACWFANAGHAYRMNKDYDHAERAFAEAVSRSGADSGDYYLAWADVLIDAGKLPPAVKLMTDRIAENRALAFDQAPFLLKLLRIHVLENDRRLVDQTLQRLRTTADDGPRRELVAVQIALLAQQLIAVHGFEMAKLIASESKTMCPADPDYDALLRIAQCLHDYRIEEARQLVSAHSSFGQDGWLFALRSDVEKFCDEYSAFEGMRPIKSAPGLRTINGIGTKLYGRRDFDARTQSYIATLCFTILFFPVLAIAAYRVVPSGGGWRFLGRMPLAKWQRGYNGVVGGAALIWMISSLAPSPPVIDTAAASYGSPSPSVAPSSLPSAPGSVILPPPLAYAGQAVNDGLPDQPATLTVQFDSMADTTTGRLTLIGLNGSGPFFSVVRADSIFLVTASASGDTIVWQGWRPTPTSIIGRYGIVGGPNVGQRGKWSAVAP